MLYKAHLLSYIEYRTPAIYHATRDILAKLDRVQTKLLQDIGMQEVDALMEFNLAPLAARRDMAMLGMIHRAVLGKGPRHFKKHFKRTISGRLHDPRESIGGELVKRSALGLVAVYNLLPEYCTNNKTVKHFQTTLQELLKRWAQEGANDWKDTLSPRIPLERHPLKTL